MKKILSSTVTVVAVMVALFLPQTMSAVGTPAGTIIESRSKVVFTSASGAVSDTVYSNVVRFTVAQKAAVNITPTSNAQTTSRDSVLVDYALTVTNSGNNADQYLLSAVSSKGWTTSFYFDANGDQSLQAEEISAGAITQTASIDADATYKVFLRVFVPKDPSLNGETDTTTVTAASVFDNTKTNTAQTRTTVQTAYFPNIVSGWSVTPTNPSPGSNVVYSITMTNSGSVAANEVSFSDLINASQFTFVTANTSTGIVNTSGNPVTWNIGTITPGGSVTISITLQVNSGLANGVTLNNTLVVTYSVGGSTFTVTSNNPSAAIGIIRGVEIYPLELSAAKEPEDTLAYSFTIKNNGNANDVLELAFTSSNGFSSWAFFKDLNQNSLLDAGDTQLSNTNGFGGVDVDTVNAYDSVKVLARLIVPNVSVDQTQEITTITVSSSFDETKMQSAKCTTSVNIADLVLIRSVTPEGSQKPETEMTFTVTYQNSGHGKAYNAVITETEPDSMTYVPNSVTINGVEKTDGIDDDEVMVTTVSGRKSIFINLGILNAQST
ncbi:MAG: hypothetical protein WCX28_14870, partial [Bacteriovoracaceae bacterium]